MKKIIVVGVLIFGILFIGFLFLIFSFSDEELKEEKSKAEKYTLKINEEDILYEYNNYVYLLTDTTLIHPNNDMCLVGLLAKEKKDYIYYPIEQEFTLLKEFNFCTVFDMKRYKKGVFLDGKFYYVSTDEKNAIEVYTLNGIDISKEVITLAEGSADLLGDFGISSIDDNYIYLMRYFISEGTSDKVRCSKTSYTCEQV